MEKLRFCDFKYQRPDVDEILKGLDAIEKRIKNAKSADEAGRAFHDFHAMTEAFVSAGQLAEIRHTIDVRDAFYNEENKFMGTHAPIVNEKGLRIYRALLASPSRAGLEAEYGALLFSKLENMIKSWDTRIVALAQEENALQAEYQRIFASARIPFRGKTLTIAQLEPYKANKDREIRKAAFIAEGTFFDAQGKKFEDIFEKMVQNRTRQAEILGYDSYADLSVVRMGRMGYGLPEISAYREQIKKFWVPAVAEIKKMQQKRIGLKDFKAYDNLLYFADRNPAPKGNSIDMLEACRTMFHRMSPETAEFFDFMAEHELFDLMAKEGKAPGGYCGCVDFYKSPFVFSNFNGTMGDIDVLIHESGHAIAAYEAYKRNVVPEYRSPSAEACEIHSIAMELLSMPYHNLFFKEDTDRYDLFLMERTITYLPGGCAGDEFQTLVYQNPDMTSGERHELWARLQKEYSPHFSEYEDIPCYSRGADWLADPHLFLCPFYLIDYGLARIVSLQLFLLQQTDANAAWRKYMDFVNAAGTRTYVDMVKSSGLKLPFEEDCIKPMMPPILEWIKSRQIQA